MLATIQWRLKEKVDSIRFDSLPIELLDSGLVFFRNYDKLNRPIAFVRLRQFPKFSQGSLLDNIKPLLIYVLETARKLTRDLTKQREQDNASEPLSSQIAVIIDIKSAPFLPLVSYSPVNAEQKSRHTLTILLSFMVVIPSRTPSYLAL